MINSYCKISFIIRILKLTENGKVSLKISEAQSICSGITLKVESSSSIPDEVSSITDAIWSDRGQFFIGSTPTTFSYLMTPSLFKTNSSIIGYLLASFLFQYQALLFPWVQLILLIIIKMESQFYSGISDWYGKELLSLERPHD